MTARSANATARFAASTARSANATARLAASTTRSANATARLASSTRLAGATARLAVLATLAAVACAAPAPAPPRAAAEPELVGVWGSEQVFVPGPAGALEVTPGAGGWRATIGDATATLQLVDGWWRGDVGDGELRFRPPSPTATLDGFWIQPSGRFLDAAYATPITLQRAGERYTAVVAPLPDVLRFYLAIARRPDGALTAFIREPAFNAGQMFRELSVERRGDAVTLRRADGKPALHGTIATRAGARHLALVIDGLDATLDLTPRGRDDAPGFYPRPLAASRYRYRPPSATGDGWPVGTLASAGLREAPIRALIQSVLDTTPTSWTSPAIHAIAIARHGVLVVDEYFAGFTADTLHDTRSAGKTWSSTLAGAAVDRGELSLATPIAAGDPDPRKAAITLEHLVTMRSGLACDDDDDDSPGNEDRMQHQRDERDWHRYMLALPMVRAPGERAVYCSGGLNLLGKLLARVEPAWLPARWQADLARPLDIARFHLNLMPNEQGYLAGGVYLRPRDFAKLPQVFLDHGMWRGRRVVSAAWVAAAIAPHAAIHTPGDYGYAWWRITYRVAGVAYEAFYAGGNGGQLAIAIPALDLVVTIMAGNYGNFATWRHFFEDLVPRYVIAAALETP